MSKAREERDVWSPYKPDANDPWTRTLAGHLYRRAAFGATPEELERAVSEGPGKTIDRLLTPSASLESFEAFYSELETASSESSEALQGWWLRRMIESPHPLLEKMTLFWHGHFASRLSQAISPETMLRHVRLLRKNALGSYQELSRDMVTDPAFMVSRGGEENRKAIPNRVFAEHLLETMVGPGAFTEVDVTATARAFTGWFVFGGQSRFVPREHDAGRKTLFGETGPFDQPQGLSAVLKQSAVAERVVRNVYRLLISEEDPPDDSLLEPLIESFAANYQIEPLIEKMLRSRHFFSKAGYRRRVKSPIELAMSILRPMQGRLSTTTLAAKLGRMGQKLHHPPSLQGWPDGGHWLNTATLVGRNNLAFDLLSGTKPLASKLDPEQYARQHGCEDVRSIVEFYLDLFLQADLDRSTVSTIEHAASKVTEKGARGIRQVVHLILTIPEFQLA